MHVGGDVAASIGLANRLRTERGAPPLTSEARPQETHSEDHPRGRADAIAR